MGALCVNIAQGARTGPLTESGIVAVASPSCGTARS